MCPDRCFGVRLGPRHVDDEARHEAAQIESSVEAVGEGREVVGGVLAVVQRVVRAGQRGLEIAQHGVDPLEFGQVPGQQVAHDHGHVDAAGVCHSHEAAQAVAAHAGARLQIGLGPLADGLGREATDHAELQIQRVPLVVERDGGDERHLVLRAAPGLATSALATEVGIVELDGPAQAVGVLALGHGAVDLLVQQPGRGVAHPELALERQGRQPGLGLADQIDRQEPGRKRQLGVLHQAARRQRCLVPAAVALEQLARTVADNVVLSRTTSRTPEALRPAGMPNGLGALRLGAEARQELRNRHAGLELDVVGGHGPLRQQMQHSLCGQWLTN